MSTFRSTIDAAAEEALRLVTDHFAINHNDAWAIFSGAAVGREDRPANKVKKTGKKPVASPGEGPHAREDLEAMTIPILATILKTNKLRMAGNKGDKIDRILDFQENPVAPTKKKKGGRKKKDKQPEPSHNHSLHAESGSHKSCDHCELYGNPLKMSPGGDMQVVNGPAESAGSTMTAKSKPPSALKPEDSASQSVLKPEDSAPESALEDEDEDEDEIAEACKMTVKSWASVASVDETAAEEERLDRILRNTQSEECTYDPEIDDYDIES